MEKDGPRLIQKKKKKRERETTLCSTTLTKHDPSEHEVRVYDGSVRSGSVLKMERTWSYIGKPGQDTDVEAQIITPSNEKDILPSEVFVDWEGPDDPQNPFNWPLWRKAVQIGLMTFNTFIT